MTTTKVNYVVIELNQLSKTSKIFSFRFLANSTMNVAESKPLSKTKKNSKTTTASSADNGVPSPNQNGSNVASSAEKITNGNGKAYRTYDGQSRLLMYTTISFKNEAPLVGCMPHPNLKKAHFGSFSFD
jgi:hypothetical protein